MRPIIFMIFVGGLLQSCSHIGGSDPIDNKEVDEVWMYEPQKGCSHNELCASGEGKNQEEADANALKSLASIFATKINAEFKYSKKSLDNAQVSELKEYIVDEVNVQVDELLKAVVITKRLKKDGVLFSLAALDKASAGEVLRQEITRLDDEIQHYYNLRNRVYMKRLIEIYNKREMLNEKLIIINTQGIPRALTFSQINGLKYDKRAPKKVFMAMDSSVPKVLEMKTQTALTDIGFEIASKEETDFELRGSYKAKQEFLNVKGFKKYTFEYFLESRNTRGQKIGGVTLNYTSHGRNEKDAFLKVRKQLLQDIDSNLDKLNLNMRSL